MSGRPRGYAVIGWREWLAIPSWGVDRIKAKIDSGARSSALHAFDMETFTRAGKDWLSFSIHPEQKNGALEIRVEAMLVDHRKVRPSTGRADWRPVVEVELALGPWRFPVEMTLIRRDTMGFRLLLGRQALRGRFLVHPGRSFLIGAPHLDPSSDSSS